MMAESGVSRRAAFGYVDVSLFLQEPCEQSSEQEREEDHE